ncbi:MAG: hypothetical protein JW806_09200 [Sedimentisphaerales bacterium]|nr:hypothetical protein [Sedimentisphaerales bacterium]
MEFLRFLPAKRGILGIKHISAIFILISIAIKQAVADDSMPAYIDPGSGSIILQVIIAGAVGTAFVLKFYFRRIVDFFKNLFSRKSDSGKS